MSRIITPADYLYVPSDISLNYFKRAVQTLVSKIPAGLIRSDMRIFPVVTGLQLGNPEKIELQLGYAVDYSLMPYARNNPGTLEFSLTDETKKELDCASINLSNDAKSLGLPSSLLIEGVRYSFDEKRRFDLSRSQMKYLMTGELYGRKAIQIDFGIRK